VPPWELEPAQGGGGGGGGGAGALGGGGKGRGAAAPAGSAVPWGTPPAIKGENRKT